MDKMMNFLLWFTVALMVIIFFAVIMIGHATNYQFLSNGVDSTVIATNTQFIVSQLPTVI